MAGGTGLRRSLDHAWPKALTAHFHQTKTRNTAHLYARAVSLELVLHPLFNSCVVASFVHIDEVDDDQPCKITQPQLSRDFLGCLKIGLKGSFLDRPFLGGPTRVHVNRNQCLGDTDDDIAA